MTNSSFNLDHEIGIKHPDGSVSWEAVPEWFFNYLRSCREAQEKMQTLNDKIVARMEMIAKDVADDARDFDGRPFNGRTVAEYFGHHGAAIAALADTIRALVKSIDKTPVKSPDKKLINSTEELYEQLRNLSLPLWNTVCACISEATGVPSDTINRNMCKAINRKYE